MPKLRLGLFVIALALYAVWSYSLTDPNLVITSWSPYWQFQQWMWQTFFVNSHLLTYSFVCLGVALFALYSWLLKKLAQRSHVVTSVMTIFPLVALCLVPLLFSYNALSHDVFNYMFNAKMVVLYHANPHVQVALEFPQDEWLRFMHNTHTPAPYGYGWTAISVVPYVFGVGKFLTSWIGFRLMSVGTIWLLLVALVSTAKRRGQTLTRFDLAQLFLNPLFLTEIVSNSHNDLWMMAAASGSLDLVTIPISKTKSSSRLAVGRIVLSALLLIFSISIKFSTLVLVPIWLGLVLLQWTPSLMKQVKLPSQWLATMWPFLASVLLFLPLLSPRSQQFQPWYLTWSLVWIPLFDRHSKLQNVWRNALLALTVSSFFRYVPWLWNGGFEGTVFDQQKWVTWIGGVILFVALQSFSRLRAAHRIEKA